MFLLDGHCTHGKNLEALQFAKENNIHLLQLSGQATHRLQPLDAAFFKTLQNHYVQAQESWMRAIPGIPISVCSVAALIGEAYGSIVGTAAEAFRGGEI